jgi:alcohol dehydrogenase class IV
MRTSFFQMFSRTIVNYGAGSRSLLPSILKGLGSKRVILLADRETAHSGIIDQIKDLFEASPGEVQIVGCIEDIEQEANGEAVNRCARFFKEHNGDSLLALGGTGALDTAKAVKWMLHKKIPDIREVGRVAERWPDEQSIPIPHVAVPTLTGTGAEITAVAMIANERNGMKISVFNPFINADTAILDPELTLYLSPEATAFTGFTTLVNAIEAYFSPKANPMTDAYAQQAIHLIANNLPIAVQDGSNLEAKGNLQLASVMAKSAFMPVASAIPVHNMALAYCEKYGVSNLLANSVLLPNVIESLPSFYLPKIQGFAQALGIVEASPNDEACLSQVVAYIRNLRKKIALPETLDGFDLQAENRKDIVLSVHQEPTGFYFKIPSEAIVRITCQVFDLPANMNLAPQCE